MCKSPFLYPGSKGKSSDLTQISPLIPKHTEYWEPFVGGGSILFQCSHANRGIISDVNQDLIDCYTAIKQEPIKMLQELPSVEPKKISEQQYRFLWNSWKANNSTELAIRGAKFLFLNRTSFQGLGGMLDQESQRYNFNLMCSRLQEASRILRNFEILAESALTVLQRAHEDVFAFVDPPYINSNNTACYKHGEWTIDSFHDLVFLLRNARYKWLLTIDNTEIAKKAFRGFNMHEHKWGKMQVKRKKQMDSELYVFNYDIPVLDDLIVE